MADVVHIYLKLYHHRTDILVAAMHVPTADTLRLRYLTALIRSQQRHVLYLSSEFRHRQDILLRECLSDLRSDEYGIQIMNRNSLTNSP